MWRQSSSWRLGLVVCSRYQDYVKVVMVWLHCCLATVELLTVRTTLDLPQSTASALPWPASSSSLLFSWFMWKRPKILVLLFRMGEWACVTFLIVYSLCGTVGWTIVLQCARDLRGRQVCGGLVFKSQTSTYASINISQAGTECVLLNLWQATRNGFKGTRTSSASQRCVGITDEAGIINIVHGLRETQHAGLDH